MSSSNSSVKKGKGELRSIQFCCFVGWFGVTQTNIVAVFYHGTLYFTTYDWNLFGKEGTKFVDYHRAQSSACFTQTMYTVVLAVKLLSSRAPGVWGLPGVREVWALPIRR